MWAAKHPRVQEPSPDVTLQQHAGKEETNDTCQRRWPHWRVSDVLPTVNDTSRVQIIKRVQKTNANVGHCALTQVETLCLQSQQRHHPTTSSSRAASGCKPHKEESRQAAAKGPGRQSGPTPLLTDEKNQDSERKQACPKSAASNGKSRNGITESIKLNLPVNYLP